MLTKCKSALGTVVFLNVRVFGVIHGLVAGPPGHRMLNCVAVQAWLISK